MISTLDPFGIIVASGKGDLHGDLPCIGLIAFWHLNVVPLVLKVNCKLANLVAEAVAVLCELLDGDAVKDFVAVNGGDKSIGNSINGIIEVLLCCEGSESHTGQYWSESRFDVDSIGVWCMEWDRESGGA